MIIVVRSLLCHVLSLLWTVALAVLWLPALALPPAASRLGGRIWSGGLIWLARIVCGVRWRVVGRERLPEGPCIVASRHESAWDTYFFPRILSDPVYVMKRELARIPLVGAYMRRAGSIVIDRSARVQALHILVDDATRALDQGLQIVVFPEGTRVPPGETRPFHAGVGVLYERCGVPVVPVALDSGRLWGRRAFLRRPGTITVAILPPIAPGLDRKTFRATLAERLESARARLAGGDDAACGQVPPRPPGKPGKTDTGH